MNYSRLSILSILIFSSLSLISCGEKESKRQKNIANPDLELVENKDLITFSVKDWLVTFPSYFFMKSINDKDVSFRVDGRKAGRDSDELIYFTQDNCEDSRFRLNNEFKLDNKNGIESSFENIVDPIDENRSLYSIETFHRINDTCAVFQFYPDNRLAEIVYGDDSSIGQLAKFVAENLDYENP